MWFISAESSNTIDSGRQRAKKERMLIIQNNLDNALQKMILCCINFLLGLTYKNIFIWKRGLHLCRIASDITGKWLIGGISCFDRLNSKLYWINGINEKSVIWRRNSNWTRFSKGLVISLSCIKDLDGVYSHRPIPWSNYNWNSKKLFIRDEPLSKKWNKKSKGFFHYFNKISNKKSITIFLFPMMWYSNLYPLTKHLI